MWHVYMKVVRHLPVICTQQIGDFNYWKSQDDLMRMIDQAEGGMLNNKLGWVYGDKEHKCMLF